MNAELENNLKIMNIKKILKDISKFFVGASKQIANALKIGKDVGNIVKQVVDSPLLDVIVNLTKTPLDNVALAYVRPRINSWLENIGWAEKKISDFSTETLPHVMNAISAEVATLQAEYEGLDLTRQQAIAAMQVVYDGKIVEV